MKKIFIFFIILMFAFACKKEQFIPASISIELPTENSQWAIKDSLHFRLNIHSELQLKECKVNIVNTQMQSVEKTLVFPLSKTSEIVEGMLLLENKYLLSGSYYIFVQVWDEKDNYSSKFTKIFISELPLESKCMFVLTQPTSGTLNISKIDTSGLQENIKLIYTDFTGSDISSEHELLFVSGSYTGPLTAYDIHNNLEIKWQQQAILNPPFRYFESVAFDGKYLISGLSEGKVKGYTSTGFSYFIFETPAMKPLIYYRHHDNTLNRNTLIIGMKHFQSSAYSISVHDDLSYYVIQFLSTDWQAVKMFRKSDDEIYILGNTPQESKLFVYSLTANNVNVLKTFPPGKLTDAEEISNGNFIISHSTGLFFYSREYNSLTPYGSFDGSGILEVDKTTNICYYAVNKKLYFFPLLALNNIQTLNFNDSITGIHILYNK